MQTLEVSYYSHHPVQALKMRAQTLCSKHSVALKNNSWHSCWSVWRELCITAHKIWPLQRLKFFFCVYSDERHGVGPSTVAQGTIEVHYCNELGQDTSSEAMTFEWHTSLVPDMFQRECSWEFDLSSLNSLETQEVICCLSQANYMWKRRIADTVPP